jgi:peptidoglycan/LPS O-acetylase OafA/YrhL
MPEAFKPAWIFLQQFAFLILICIVSWKLIEKPINNLKKKFEYKRTGRPDVIEKADPNAFSY